MRQVFFALFEDAKEADAAVTELGDLDAGQERCQVDVHRGDLHHDSLPIGETRGQTRLAQGALLGAALGALLGGLVLGPAGLMLAGPLGAAVMCGVLGMVMGGLGGLLTGVAGPDTKLQAMEELIRRGAVVVAVDARGSYERDQAEQIVRRHGAVVQHPALL